MKLLFVVTGIGLGHTIREEAIINELKDKDVEVRIAGFKTSYKYFKRKYKTVKLYGHNFPDNSFKISLIKVLFSNLLYPLSWLHDFIKLSKVILSFNPDKVIVDAQPIGAFVGRLFRKKVISIYNLDLKSWDKFHKKLPFLMKVQSWFYYNTISSSYKNSDLVIIPSVKRLRSDAKVKFVNPIIRENPKDLDTQDKIMKRLTLRKKPILVMLGGSKFGFSIIERLLRSINKFNEDFIVFGYYKPFNSLRDNLRVLSFTDNFLEYLKVCKGIIVIAGHNTLVESLVFKKPALVLPIKNYVEHHLNVDNLPYVKVGHLDKVNTKNVEDLIGSFLDEIPEMNKKLKKLKLKGDGVKESVNIILNGS